MKLKSSADDGLNELTRVNALVVKRVRVVQRLRAALMQAETDLREAQAEATRLLRAAAGKDVAQAPVTGRQRGEFAKRAREKATEARQE